MAAANEKMEEELCQSESLALNGSLRGVKRPESLPGITYKLTNVVVNNQPQNVYLTVNEFDGNVFEIFVNSKDAQIAELITITTLTVTRMLRNDIKVEDIVKDFFTVSSTTTGHYRKGGYCPSLAARIGETLLAHVKKGGLQKLVTELQPVVIDSE